MNHIILVLSDILTAQIERKAKLENALKCEKERLSAIKRDIMCIDQKIKRHKNQQKDPIRSSRVRIKFF